MVCHSCSREIKLINAVGRRDECPHCNSDLHTCVNCRFFDPGKNNQCAESAAEYVQDKRRANFCDFFEPNTRMPLNTRGSGTKAVGDDVKSAFDALFKNK